MNPKELRYTEDHEWVGEENGVIVVGITDHAQAALGDITYVELPEPGTEVAAHDEVAVVESVKAASDVYAPISGTISDVNLALDDAPELVNQDPYGAGWFFALENVDMTELNALMDAAAYEAFLAASEEEG